MARCHPVYLQIKDLAVYWARRCLRPTKEFYEELR